MLTRELSAIEVNVLKALAKYKFLTASQMVDLEISGSIVYMRRVLQENPQQNPKKGILLTAWYIGRMESKPNGGAWRTKWTFFLTRQGEKFLLEELMYWPEEIERPIKQPRVTTHYLHRLQCLDFEIILNKWAEKHSITIIFFDRYFDYLGKRNDNLRPKTRLEYTEAFEQTKLVNRYNKQLGREEKVELSEKIKLKRHLISDWIFALRWPMKDELYCMELYRGVDARNTKRKILGHLYALENGSATERYNFGNRGNRVLVVLEEKNQLKHVTKRLQKDPRFRLFKKNFLFTTLSELTPENFLNVWVDFDGVRIPMLTLE